jgi:hypothetical protein
MPKFKKNCACGDPFSRMGLMRLQLARIMQRFDGYDEADGAIA